MQVLAFLLCDRMWIERNGTATLQGAGITQLIVPARQLKPVDAALFIALRRDLDEPKYHHVAITLKSPDGQMLSRAIDHEFETDDARVIRIATPVRLAVLGPGPHVMELIVNGQVLSRWPLEIIPQEE